MRNNNFDLLRLLAALGVFLAHGLFLYDNTLPTFFNNAQSLGALSVYTFFFISGHLTLQSWQRAPRLTTFAVKRSLRIFPGLVVASAFSVFVIGTVFTTMNHWDYLRSPSTWEQFFNYASALATRHELPGVFEQLPFPRSVNGSLWTIKYEIAMYVLLVLCGIAGLLSRRALWPITAICVLATQLPQPWSILSNNLLQWREFWPFACLFFTGAAFNYLPTLRSSWMILPMLAGFALTFAHGHPGLVQLGVLIGLPCLIWCLAYAPPLTRLKPHSDLSYGIYIYAFPIQQALTEISLAHGLSKSVCLLTALALTLLLAYMSWHYIERPAITWGQRFVVRQRCHP